MTYLFEIKDMELINYWINEGDINDLISYSGEFKELMGYKNFRIDCRYGDDPPFYTMAAGLAPFSYNGTVYDFVEIGVKANHVIFVPDETGDTPEELKEAVLKRIEEYIGDSDVEIAVVDGEDPLDIMLSGYDGAIASAEESVANAEANIAMTEGSIAQCVANIEEYEALRNTDPTYYDELIAQEEQSKSMYEGNLENDMMSLGYAQDWLENATNARQEYIDEYNTEGGDNYYLNEAAGDCYFTMTIGEGEYSFVVVKDSDRMITPEYKSSDVKTGITVDSTDSSIPLDTLISVDELTSGKTYEDIMAVLDVEDSKSFDINLFSSSLDKYITKLANGEFKVRIPIGAEFDGKDLIVYYVDEDKEIYQHEVTVEGKYAVFTTNHFSIYTLAATETIDDIEDEETTEPTGGDTTPDTGDGSNVWLLFAIIGLSAVAICGIGSKRKVSE